MKTMNKFRMTFEDMGSSMTDYQFMIHVLNNLTGKANPLKDDERREELNLQFERLKIQS